MEIERKFLVKTLPENLENYNNDDIIQGYISFKPEIRVRKRGEKYYYTEKGEGTLFREETEKEITEAEFSRFFEKCNGVYLEKTRYLIPLENNLVAELDIYKGKLSHLKVIEVEFSNLEHANGFIPPEWFGEEITEKTEFRNKNLALIAK
jgi:CYTH domain-containing protein